MLGATPPGLPAPREIHGNVSLVRGNVNQTVLPTNATNIAFVIEDVREAEIELLSRGFTCERITHHELLASAGTRYAARLMDGTYSLVWISTPSDWSVRIPGNKVTAHWQRVQQWIHKTATLGIILIIFGPPGFLWKLPNIRETMEECELQVVRMRLCHFKERYDKTSTVPSGAYLQFATNQTNFNTRRWQCPCKLPISDHKLDWYDRNQANADWRRRMRALCVRDLCNALRIAASIYPTTTTTMVHAIADDMSPPLPTVEPHTAAQADSAQPPPRAPFAVQQPPLEAKLPTIHPLMKQAAFPTEGRIKQKERLKKLKEQGIEPTKKKKYTEPGNDDCGLDLSGLGSDIYILSCDVQIEDISDNEADASKLDDLELAIYPSTASGSSDPDPGKSRLPRGGMGCPACHANIRKDSIQHTRNTKTCLYPWTRAIVWDCPACQDDKGRNSQYLDHGHTYNEGECRYSDRGPPQRTGAHPREPRATATSHSSAGASSLDAASSEDPAPAVVQPDNFGDHDAVTPGDRGDATPAEQADEARAGRGPDRSQRVRRTYSSSGAGPTRLPDWSRFNIQISLGHLRSPNPAVVEKELRKLHLRWWHASEPKMRNLLYAAGLDEVRLAMIKVVTDTCRECRAWKKRGNVTMPSVHITTKFNENGECDIMFYKRYRAFHIIDRAIRLSGGCLIEDRESSTLLSAYWTSWVQHHGPFQTLYSDGELGLNNAESIAELKRLGTELKIRAPDQHARLAESRQSMLRHVMHLIEEDLKRHSHRLEFPRLYAEAIFVVNAFSFYNGVSPYNAHTGRQPACLPDFENPDYQSGGEIIGDTGREQRIRLSAMEAITQSTAVAKTNRALKAKTTIDGSRLFNPGDLIDYYRPTATKDEFGGWNGPYPVVRNVPDEGKVVCRTDTRELNVRYPDARLSLYIEAIMTANVGMDNDAMDVILEYIGNLAAGKPPITFGYNASTLTTASQRAPKIYLALQFIIRNFFRVSDVYAVRLGKSVAHTHHDSNADGSTLIHYTTDNNPTFHYYESKDTALDIFAITHNNKTRFMQCLIKRGCSKTIDDMSDIAQELTPPAPPLPPREDTGPPEPTTPTIHVGGDLSPIYEDNEERDDDALTLECFYSELMSTQAIEDDDAYKQVHGDVNLVPVHMMPYNSVLFTAPGDEQVAVSSMQEHPEGTEIFITEYESDDYEPVLIDRDEYGEYVELCFTTDMAKVVLDEDQYNAMIQSKDQIPTVRVYISKLAKRAVVVKEDDLLSKKDLLAHASQVSSATYTEIETWIKNKCFTMIKLKDAQNIMTSRYVAKWKWVKQPDNEWKCIIRMRLVLRGFMDIEAFDLDTFSGTARRQSQRMLASQVACNPTFINASLDVNNAFLKGFTYAELAEATGEKERMVCFTLPPGSAAILRRFKGFEDFDETIHCLQCVKPGTGTKDAPRAFNLKLQRIIGSIGLYPTSFDQQFFIKDDLLTANHVDDVNMAGTEAKIDEYALWIEQEFDKCKLSKRQYTNCGVQSTLLDNHDVTQDQDAYIDTLRPIVSNELTGAPAERDATKVVSDMFVSLRGALAYTAMTQVWIMVYIVALQRVQQPTNLDVRRLNAVVRKLKANPQRLIYRAMQCHGNVDLHSDSGYRRLDSEKDIKGYGMRGLNCLRRGVTTTGEEVVHLLDSICKSHRLVVRSSYGAEIIAASHGFDDSWPTIITLEEMIHGVYSPEQLKDVRENGGLSLQVTLTIDAEGVYKSVTARDLKVPAEKTLLGHVSWLRECLRLQFIVALQWCDTRDMTADGHTKGCIDREMLISLMQGHQKFSFPVKRYSPPKAIKDG